jgi:maleate isomerase
VTVIDDSDATHAQVALHQRLGAVEMLADARMDAYLWCGTSGSWEGIDRDRALVAAIRERTSAPATTATLALLDAFRALGTRRYGLVVPYVAPIARRITDNFAAAGFECAAVERDELTENWQFAAISADSIAARVRRVAAARPDAIAIHCTNLRGAEVATSLERELGVPVLDSVAVGLWGVLSSLGVELPANGFGSLAGHRA